MTYMYMQSEFYLHNHITKQFFPLKIKYKTNPKASYDIIFFYILNMLCT